MHALFRFLYFTYRCLFLTNSTVLCTCRSLGEVHPCCLWNCVRATLGNWFGFGTSNVPVLSRPFFVLWCVLFSNVTKACDWFVWGSTKLLLPNVLDWYPNLFLPDLVLLDMIMPRCVLLPKEDRRRTVGRGRAVLMEVLSNDDIKKMTKKKEDDDTEDDDIERWKS